jgi:hypothetical protein
MSVIRSIYELHVFIGVVFMQSTRVITKAGKMAGFLRRSCPDSS